MSVITLGLFEDFHSEAGNEATAALTAATPRWFGQLERARQNFVALNQLAPIKLARVTLTDAEIKALPTTPITIVAAPAAGLAIVPVVALLKSATSAGAYTNIAAASEMGLYFATSGAQAFAWIPNDASITNGSATRLSDLLGSTTNKRVVLTPEMDTENVDEWGPLPYVQAVTDVEAQALMLTLNNHGSGNLTGGNAANSLRVDVLYMVI